MALIVQAVTLSEEIVEGARWETSLPWAQEGQSITVQAAVRDPDVVDYVRRTPGRGCIADEEGKAYVVSMNCTVRKIRHMVNADTGSSDTLISVTPVNRFVEGILTYLMCPTMCDPKFAAAVRREKTETKGVKERPAS
jgi:hypothetical protein